LKICLICNQIAAWGKIGGYGMATRRLGAGLAARGHEVHAVVPRRKGQPKVDDLDGIRVHGQSLREVFFGKRLFREIDADVYHVEEPNYCGYVAQQACPDAAHVVTSRDPREGADWRIEFVHATWSRRLKFPAQYFYENSWRVHTSVHRAHGVYAEAEPLVEKAQRRYGLSEPPRLVPKPLPLPDLPIEKSPQPTCAFVARFDPRKRPEIFFELARRNPEIAFIAIGQAHDQGRERHLESTYYHLPNLTVTGFIDPFSDATMQRVMRSSWILVHPAVREGLPTVFLEASSYEMAILAFLDPDGHTSRFGRLVPAAGGIDAMEAQLRDLIATGEWRSLGKAGREYLNANHCLSLSVDRHLELYREALQRSGGGSLRDRER
jgi:glycosyltransferase involved in cell wall biosynthesis